MNTKTTGAGASEGAGDPKVQLAMSQEQFDTLITKSIEAARATATIAARDEINREMPNINQRINETAMAAANTAAAAAVHRREKASALKQHGITAGIATAVFVAGSLAMVGYDKYNRRDRQNPNQQQAQ